MALQVIAVAWAVLFAGALRAANIVYPWRATTAIVKAGERFPVWFSADAGQTVGAVELQGPFNAVTATHAVEVGSWEYDQTSGNRYNTRVLVTVPPGTPADRYDLVLRTTAGEVRSSGAVKVVQDYASEYYIVHLSDIHAFQHGYDDTLRKLSALVEMANIIGPELVFITGDNLYRPSDDRLAEFFDGNRRLGTKGLAGFSAATFMVCGNHDYDMDRDDKGGNHRGKSAWYNRWWGLQAYQFSYGEGRFMVINNGWEGFDAGWQIAAAESWLHEVGAGNFRLAAAHIRSRRLEPLHQSANLTMALVGHHHQLASDNPHMLVNDPIQYIANSVRDHWEFNLFRVDGRTGKFVPVSGPTGRVQVVSDAADGGPAAANLAREFRHPNDGTSAANEVTIVSRLGFEILGARVRFVMPAGRAYSVSGGTIEQSFAGTAFRIVDVRVDVPANRAVAVSISADTQ